MNIEDRFVTSATAPKPTDEQREASRQVTADIVAAGRRVEESTVPGRWQSLAFTALEEALMWANKSIYNEGGRS